MPSEIPSVSNAPSFIWDWSQRGSDVDGEAAYDQSGSAVSLSHDGNTMAVGAPYNDGISSSSWHNSGHVRVYDWIVSESGSAWVQRGSDIDGEAGTNFGTSVSMSNDGNTVAIGAIMGLNTRSGRVQVYDWIVSESGSAWVQRGSNIDGEGQSDQSGSAVSLSGDSNTIAIGAPYNVGINGYCSGHVRVYDWIVSESGSAWVQRGSDIDGEAEYDYSGSDVSLSNDGNTVAIGAPSNAGINGFSSGHVRVYDWIVSESGSAWVQRGSDIDGEAAGDGSGHSIDLSADGNTLAIGAKSNAGINGRSSGHVRVYDWDGSASDWVQRGSDIDGEAANDNSGSAVSLSDDGNTVAIAAQGNEYNGVSTCNFGHVRVYTWKDAAWVQSGSDIDGEAEYDNSGSSVSLSGDGMIVAIGTTMHHGNDDAWLAGHVRVFSLPPLSMSLSPTLSPSPTSSMAPSEWNWSQRGSDVDGEAMQDQSGYSVSLSHDGNTVAIGASSNSGINGFGSGHVRVYDWIVSESGSAWVQRGSDIDGEAHGDESGSAVSLSGDSNTIAIGAPSNVGINGYSSGHVRVYDWIVSESGSAWVQRGSDIDGEAYSHFGKTVSMSNDGNTVAIGAPDGGSSAPGYAQVYDWIVSESGSAWVQRGSNIDGEAGLDKSGSAVSLSGDSNTIAIGAPGNDGNGIGSGHVRVYDWIVSESGSAWVQRGSDIDGEALGDNSGSAVSLSDDGNTVAIAAQENGVCSSYTGHVRVYDWNDSDAAWVQRGSDIDGEAASDYSGYSVSLSGDGMIVAIGSVKNSGSDDAWEAGHVRVFS
jgi:hypothetical protein